MEPTAKMIATTLSELEAQERGTDRPRSLAKAAIKRWRSNAEREKLPVANQHDNKGARVLDVTATLAHDHHDARLGRK